MPPVQAPQKEKEAPKTERGEATIPNIVLTFEQVKGEVDANRGGRFECPEAVVREIVKSNNPKGKIAEVKKALDEIAKDAGEGAGYAFSTLEDNRIAGLFVSHTKEFVEIAKDAGEGAGYAFYVLGDTSLEVDKQLLDDLLVKYKFEQKSFEPFIARYGVRPMKIVGFLDKKPGILDGPEYDAVHEKEVYFAVLKIAKEKNLDPELLAAAVFQEGLVLVMYMYKRPSDYSVGSFDTLGMDAFYSDLGSLKTSGYLRDDFSEGREFKIDLEITNEKGFAGKSVVFRDLTAVIEAFGAMLAQRRGNFLETVRSMGVDPKTLSQEQLWAGSYLFYNCANPSKLLKEVGLENLLKKYEGGKRYRFNYMRVVSTAAYLKSVGIFGENHGQELAKE